MTPHIEANINEIAKIVLMPGDPKRCKYIAETYLEEYKLVSSVRNIYAYTGKYKGKEVTIMASGMGMPSIGIYSYELYKFYNVDTIIRIGSAGSYTKDINLYDVLLVSDAYTDSSFAKVYNGKEVNLVKSDETLNQKIEEVAIKNNINLKKGIIHSTDVFYNSLDITELYNNKHCLGVEMESFALLYIAKSLNKKATCLLTITDNLITKEKIEPLERQKSLNEMIKLALDSAL